MAIRNKRDGFSLIEVAIGLLIIGLMIGPMMMEYTAWVSREQYQVTKDNGTFIEDALTKYVENYGCYPVPAMPGVNSSSAAAGIEAVTRATCVPLTVAQLVAIPPCVASDPVVCQEPAAAGVAGVGPVLVGDVPYNTLGLPKKYILDGYGRKYTYAVSANLVLDALAPTFDDAKGAIKVVDLKGNGPPQGTFIGGVINAHYAVISHGKDGAGAFTLDNGGFPVAACAAPGGGRDVENCTYNDGTFDTGFDIYRDVNGTQQYNRQESRVAGAGHFDDYVYDRTSISTDIWKKEASTSDILNNTDPGNVLINNAAATSGPAKPQGKLDVRGDLSADQLWTNIICDTSGNSFAAGAYTNKPCTGFSPSAIAATPPKVQAPGDNHIHCNMINSTVNGTTVSAGVPMIGIAAGDEVCADVTNDPAGTTQVPIQNTYNFSGCSSTTPAQYPYGTDGTGNVLCRTP
jgi:type II secretory pathway pseudopilin PulG